MVMEEKTFSFRMRGVIFVIPLKPYIEKLTFLHLKNFLLYGYESKNFL